MHRQVECSSSQPKNTPKKGKGTCVQISTIFQTPLEPAFPPLLLSSLVLLLLSPGWDLKGHPSLERQLEREAYIPKANVATLDSWRV